jgi:hypothetical protein
MSPRGAIRIRQAHRTKRRLDADASIAIHYLVGYAVGGKCLDVFGASIELSLFAEEL